MDATLPQIVAEADFGVPHSRLISNMVRKGVGGPGGTRTPCALLRTQKNQVKILKFESADVSHYPPKSTV
jgi:hypothetical protein